jgi:hypothetical protein
MITLILRLMLKVKVKNTQKVVNALAKKGKQAQVEVKKMIADTAVGMKRKAQENVESNDSIAFGYLISGIKTEAKNNGFSYQIESSMSYSAAVEYGRKSGKMPPSQPMQDWVKKKGLAKDEKEVKLIAFLIARSIGENGTTPKPFFIPAFIKARARFRRMLKKLAIKYK